MLLLNLFLFLFLFVSLAKANLLTCLNAIGAPVLTSSSPKWANKLLMSNYNARFPVVPAAIVQPNTTAEIAKLLACAKKNKVKVSPLCGGHSFASYGVGGVDGALVVDMSLFKVIKLSADTKQVAVGGGVNVGELATFLGKHGMLFPHARGSFVGVVGSAIGGGFGTTSRLFGTTLDTVVGVDMILPNGTVVHSTAQKNPDILFASLGAANSYGIITTIYLRTISFKTFPTVVVYSYSLPPNTVQQAVDQYVAFQDFGLKAPAKLSLRISTQFGGGNSEVSGAFYGNMGDFKATIAPLLAKLPKPVKSNVKSMPFMESEVAITGSLDTRTRDSFQPSFYVQSAMPTKPYNNATLLAFFKKLESQWSAHPHLWMFTFTDLWGGAGSYSSNLANQKDTSAFVHTDAQFLVRLDGDLKSGRVWPKDGVAFMEAIMPPLYEAEQAQEGHVRSYLNYRDTAYNMSEWSSRYFGPNFDRLRQLKAVIDPSEVMSAVPQSIPLP